MTWEYEVTTPSSFHSIPCFLKYSQQTFQYHSQTEGELRAKFQWRSQNDEGWREVNNALSWWWIKRQQQQLVSRQQQYKFRWVHRRWRQQPLPSLSQQYHRWHHQQSVRRSYWQNEVNASQQAKNQEYDRKNLNQSEKKLEGDVKNIQQDEKMRNRIPNGMIYPDGYRAQNKQQNSQLVENLNQSNQKLENTFSELSQNLLNQLNVRRANIEKQNPVSDLSNIKNHQENILMTFGSKTQFLKLGEQKVLIKRNGNIKLLVQSGSRSRSVKQFQTSDDSNIQPETWLFGLNLRYRKFRRENIRIKYTEQNKSNSLRASTSATSLPSSIKPQSEEFDSSSELPMTVDPDFYTTDSEIFTQIDEEPIYNCEKNAEEPEKHIMTNFTNESHSNSQNDETGSQFDSSQSSQKSGKPEESDENFSISQSTFTLIHDNMTELLNPQYTALRKPQIDEKIISNAENSHSYLQPAQKLSLTSYDSKHNIPNQLDKIHSSSVMLLYGSSNEAINVVHGLKKRTIASRGNSPMETDNQRLSNMESLGGPMNIDPYDQSLQNTDPSKSAVDMELSSNEVEYLFQAMKTGVKLLINRIMGNAR